MDRDERAAPSRASTRRLPVELLLFLGLLSVYAYFIQPPGANALTRYDLVLAIAEQGTTAIDAYHENTNDKGYYAGHYYSDKPFGVSMLSLPFYLAIRALFSHIGAWPLNDQYVVYFLNLFAVAVPSALLAILVYRGAIWLGVGRLTAALAATVYGSGTMALPFATLYFGHQTSAFFGFAAFLVLLKSGPRPRPGPWVALAGALAGAAVVTEYPLVIVAALLAVYLWARLRSLRLLALYAAGGLPFAVSLGVYNFVNYGSPFSVTYEHVFVTEFAGMHEGLFGVTLPNGWALLDLLAGGKGLLTNSPVLALAPVGVWLMWRARRWRAEALLITAIVTTFAVYNAAYFLPFGGWAPGPRFLVPVLPFATLAVAVAMAHNRRIFALALPLAAASIAIMFLATATAPLVGDYPRVPLPERWLPAFESGELAFNLGTVRFGLYGLPSLLPLAGLLGLVVGLWAIGSVRAVPAAGAGLSYATAAVMLLALQWPAPLPGLPFSAASQIPAHDPVVLVQSVRELPSGSDADGLRAVEIVVRSASGLAPNVGLWLGVEDAYGRPRQEHWSWPLNLMPGQPARFVLSWREDEEGLASRVGWVTVKVQHSSLAYYLAEVRTAVIFHRQDRFIEDRKLGFTTVE